MTHSKFDQRPFYCEILGVSLDATPSEIRDAYIRRAKIFHPDHRFNLEQAKIAFQLLTEAYEYLKRNKFDRSQQAQSVSSASAPAPPAPEVQVRPWNPYRFAIAVLVAFFSGMIWHPFDNHEASNASASSAPKLFAQAQDFFQQQKYDECLNSLFALDKIQHAYGNSLELELTCTEGKKTVEHLAHWKPTYDGRGPASVGPTIVDLSQPDLKKTLCSSDIPRAIEKMTQAPPLPKVKVIQGFLPFNEGIAKLSQQLNAQFTKEMVSTRILSTRLNSWCGNP